MQDKNDLLVRRENIRSWEKSTISPNLIILENVEIVDRWSRLCVHKNAHTKLFDQLMQELNKDS